MPGLRHVVNLTFRDDTSPEQLDEIVAALRALPASIPELQELRRSAPTSGRSDGNASLAIVADFDDWAGYEAYRDHPDHLAVGNRAHHPACSPVALRCSTSSRERHVTAIELVSAPDAGHTRVAHDGAACRRRARHRPGRRGRPGTPVGTGQVGDSIRFTLDLRR